MKLISARQASLWDMEHAFSAKEARDVVQQHLSAGQKIEGLQSLRSAMMLNFDSQVVQQVESGEWVLIKPEANCFNWGQFDKAVRDQRVMEVMQHPIVQPKPVVLVVQMLDSEILEPLVSRLYTAIIDGVSQTRTIDALGITHLPESAKGAKVVIKLT
ncbi:hypothetical protein ACIQYF_05580 [Pseudomonas sp. NPDC096917]|uniref:hypothetical protein n=1 Tax=Pseudomonas sp. NPDC096917 TaxID=3364483 RepID=UPI00383AD86C